LSNPPEEPTEPEIPGELDPQGEPRVRRSHSERREEAESRILAAAVDIVAERGLQDLTLAECGQAAGYSRGLAAHYFGSRDQLIGSIAQYIVGEYTKRLRSSGPRPITAGRAGLEDFLEQVSFYISSNRNSPRHTRAFHAVLGAAFKQAPLADTVAELNRNSIAAFAAGIRAGIEAGEIRADVNVSAQAALIVATVRGIVRQWLLDSSVDLELIGKELVDNLRRSLAR
jgi:AcrR family transcriptional regulator